MQNKPNFLGDQMNVSSFITTNYEQRTMNYEIKNKPKTNPIQSQYKPNTKPIRTQFKPKQTQFQGQYYTALGLLELYAMGFRTDIIMLLRSLSGKTLFKGYT
jgi:hypothetical protein